MHYTVALIATPSAPLYKSAMAHRSKVGHKHERRRSGAPSAVKSITADPSSRCVSVARGASFGAFALGIIALLLLLAAQSNESTNHTSLHVGIALLQLLAAVGATSILYGWGALGRWIGIGIAAAAVFLLLAWAFNYAALLAVLRLYVWSGIPIIASDLDLALMFALQSTAVSVYLLAQLRSWPILYPFLWSIALCAGLFSLFLVLQPMGQLQSARNVDLLVLARAVLALALFLQNVALVAAVGEHPQGTEWSVYLSVLGFVALSALGGVLTNQSRKSEFRQLSEATEKAAGEVTNSINHRVSSSKTALAAVLAHWNALQWRVTDDVWMKDVSVYMGNFPTQKGIVEFDSQERLVRGVVREASRERRSVFTTDAATLQLALGDQRTLSEALHQVIVTHTQHGYVRVHANPRIDAALFPMLGDARQIRGVLLVLYEPSRLATGIVSDVAREFDVDISADGDVLYRRTTVSAYGDLPEQFAVRLPPSSVETGWVLHVWPSDIAIRRYLMHWPGLPLLLCWAAVIIYSLALFYARRSQEMAADRERILEQSLDLICTLTAAGEFVTVSTASMRLFGYLPEELKGKAWDEIIHPKEREQAQKVLQQVIAAGPVHDFEIRGLRKDQTRIYTEWSMRWSAEAGMLYCVARDISESKLNQLRLRDREEVFRRAAEFSGTIVLSWDVHGKRPLLVGAVERVFDPNESFVGNWEILRRRIHPDDAETYVGMRDRNFQSSGTAQGVYRVKMADGTYGVFDISISTWEDSESGLMRHLGMLTDATQRELVNRARRHYTEQLAALSELARRVTSMRSHHELCTAIADAMLDLLLAKQAAVIVGSSDNEESSCVVAKVPQLGAGLQPRPSAHMAALVAHTDAPIRLTKEEVAGRALWACEDAQAILKQINGWLAVPLIGREGVHIGSLHVGDRSEGVFTDADETVMSQLAGLVAATLENLSLYDLLEDRVAERTRELELSNRELEAFSYSVSHDLRAPLRAIGGFTGLLRQDYASKLEPPALNYLARIESGVKRMADLIDDLLSLARVSRIEVFRQPLDLSALAQRIVEEQRERATPRQIEVRIDPDMRTSGDPRLVLIILENLIQNALKFTGTRPVAHIHIGQRRDSEECIFFVADNGVGFDPAHASHLFGLFQRLHSLSEFPGTGVGLATVHRIVQRHHGRIWAQASIDEGATFFFTLGV